MLTATVPVVIPESVPTEIQQLDTQAKDLQITTPEAATLAKQLWKQADTEEKRTEEAMKAECAPHTEAINVIKDKANVVLTLIRNARNTLKAGLLRWDEACEAVRKELQEKANAQYAKKIEKEEAKAERLGVPVKAIAPPPVMQQQPKSEAGVTYVTVPTWDILGVVIGGKAIPGADLSRDNPDLKDVPDMFFTRPMLDCAAITALAKKKKAVPGVTLRDAKTLANR